MPGRMAPLPRHRDKIIQATAELIRQRGYAATGINEIAERSNAPKGSLYHYFPGGKDDMTEHALRYAGALVRETIERLAQTSASPAEAMVAYGNLLAGWMAKSGYVDGCPIATTILELRGDQEALRISGRDAYRSWCEAISAMLAKRGVPAARAGDLALIATMLLEGALILARAERNSGPIVAAFEEIGRMFEDVVTRG